MIPTAPLASIGIDIGKEVFHVDDEPQRLLVFDHQDDGQVRQSRAPHGLGQAIANERWDRRNVQICTFLEPTRSYVPWFLVIRDGRYGRRSKIAVTL
jgi:hypothetical protein